MTDGADIYTNGTGEQLGGVKECFGHRGRRSLDKVLTPQRVRLRKKAYFAEIFCGLYSLLPRDDNVHQSLSFLLIFCFV